MKLSFNATRAVLEWPKGIREDELLSVPDDITYTLLMADRTQDGTPGWQLQQWLDIPDLPKRMSLPLWRCLVELPITWRDAEHYCQPSKPRLEGFPKPTPTRAWSFDPPRIVASWPGSR